MDGKIYLDANSLTRDSFRLAKQILDSGFVPDVIVALWRGGTPVGIVVHEVLNYSGVDCYHTVVKTCSYTGIGEHAEPVIENLDPVLARLTAETRVLVVDDIFDSGRTARAIRNALRPCAGEVRFAMLYYKPGGNETDFSPDFHVGETDRWIVFPHELMGLTPAEIREKDPFIHGLLALDEGER